MDERAIFDRAAELRQRLKDVRANTERETKREAEKLIKRDAFELLCDAELPMPLRILIVELWGWNDRRLKRDAKSTNVESWSKSTNVESWSEGKLAAAFLLAQHGDILMNQGGGINAHKLEGMLQKQLRNGKEYRAAIRRWSNEAPRERDGERETLNDFWMLVETYRKSNDD